jgi:hypothetical protein
MKLCALLLLVLALSPFTAPFQTCDLADSTSGTGTDEAVILTPPAVVHTSLLLAPVSQLVISNMVAPRPAAFLALPITPPPDIGGSSFPPTVLRV